MPAAARGRAAGKSAKVWREALERALFKKLDPSDASRDAPRRLEGVAEAVVNAALGGDMAAAREIGDRLDGKPAQALTGEDGGAIIVQIVKYAADEKAK